MSLQLRPVIRLTMTSLICCSVRRTTGETVVGSLPFGSWRPMLNGVGGEQVRFNRIVRSLLQLKLLATS